MQSVYTYNIHVHVHFYVYTCCTHIHLHLQYVPLVVHIIIHYVYGSSKMTVFFSSLQQTFTCFASIPIAYLFSFIFKNHLVAYGLYFISFYFPSLVSICVLLLYMYNVRVWYVQCACMTFSVDPTLWASCI